MQHSLTFTSPPIGGKCPGQDRGKHSNKRKPLQGPRVQSPRRQALLRRGVCGTQSSTFPPKDGRSRENDSAKSIPRNKAGISNTRYLPRIHGYSSRSLPLSFTQIRKVYFPSKCFGSRSQLAHIQVCLQKPGDDDVTSDI